MKHTLKNKPLVTALTALLFGALAGGCTSDNSSATAETNTSTNNAQTNTAPTKQAEVEVLHWWTSGGEAAAIGVLKDDMAQKGIGWRDVPVAGGGGAAMLTALKTRVVSGNPPTAAQLNMAAVQEWAAEGLLEDITDIAQKQNWDQLLPDTIKDVITYQGRYIGAPINIHRVNWLWINAKVLADNNLSPPATWDEFYAVGDALKEKGIIPLALGSDPWQEIFLFENLVMGLGGSDFYKKAIIELDSEALGSEQMVQVFEHMRRLKGYMDTNTVGRTWNEAASMVMNGQAAMQLMGDWVKGEIVNANLVPGEDILCAPAPGTAGTALIHGDVIVMYNVGEASKAAQQELASNIMDGSFQERFNLLKGSVPARLDVPEDKFDACGKQSMSDIRQAIADNSLHLDLDGGALPPAIQGAFYDVVTQHFNSNQSASDAAAALVRSIESLNR